MFSFDGEPTDSAKSLVRLGENTSTVAAVPGVAVVTGNRTLAYAGDTCDARTCGTPRGIPCCTAVGATGGGRRSCFGTSGGLRGSAGVCRMRHGRSRQLSRGNRDPYTIRGFNNIFNFAILRLRQLKN
jgi:hypothetical protein